MQCKRFLQMMILAVLGISVTGNAALAQRWQSWEVSDLRVSLPDVKAQLRIEGVPTRQTGKNRLFVTPPLQPGYEYVYTLSATWQPNNYTTITRIRSVQFRPGQRVEADLRESDKDHPDDVFVRYVPTPHDVVDAMLKLAEVGKDDVVFDLGCGDGRIVIAAVSKFGAKRGIGVDLDAQRIHESRANARQQSVDHRVEFRQEDVLKIKDLSTATVVALYMGDELNLQLRPILQKLLKPGSRIVSHRFTMGDWNPLKTESITGSDSETYLLHLWKVGQK